MLPPTPNETWVEVGQVIRPHGLKGNLLVSLHGDDSANLISTERVTLSGKSGSHAFQVRGAEPTGQTRDGRARVRLSLVGLESRESAETWSGAKLSIPESALPPLPEGEFYWRDVLGLRCRLPSGADLGVVEEIWPTGSNDVLVVRRGEELLLIPALREVLMRVDRKARELWINPPPGLLEGD
jgi:16S rRNA processing protein RimM